MTKNTPYIHTAPYPGPILAVVLDWAGTAVDHGSLGPTAVFARSFAEHGVDVTLDEIRPFMGLEKIDHVRAMLKLDSVAAKWREAAKTEPDEKAVNAVYALLEPMMVEAVTSHAEPITGVVEAMDALRRRGVAIGSCTGYTLPMMEALVPVAAAHGYAPDYWTCASEAPAGRPWPWMCYQNAMALDVYPMEAMVKVGDTVSDIQEGRNAGMWAVGVCRTGNELGLSEAEVASLDPAELRRRMREVADRFFAAGAHFVVESAADLEIVIDDIEGRMQKGVTPLFAGPISHKILAGVR
ncbi:phosphonoacetaldehyde hydrolase [Oceanidesulfovibrio marinus]|uniref:Phosphonoacetaldehyde hydrolase n=1 Tax=Oceanidesulfovibrio marinus TaxID=370038 RepID=A0A6P1ZJM2_9BACT|nr:phosphonoacetaldehyde hydrolase [Oceanidesulfovibrio marinus]TVM33786.1 phosphonoacetaldehyde hydrolase [Oceanidesulfovibrio marinus]